MAGCAIWRTQSGGVHSWAVRDSSAVGRNQSTSRQSQSVFFIFMWCGFVYQGGGGGGFVGTVLLGRWSPPPPPGGRSSSSKGDQWTVVDRGGL